MEEVVEASIIINATTIHIIASNAGIDSRNSNFQVKYSSMQIFDHSNMRVEY